MYTDAAYGYGIRLEYGYFDRSMKRILPYPYTKPDREIQKMTSEMMSCPCHWETHPNPPWHVGLRLSNMCLVGIVPFNSGA